MSPPPDMPYPNWAALLWRHAPYHGVLNKHIENRVPTRGDLELVYGEILGREPSPQDWRILYEAQANIVRRFGEPGVFDFKEGQPLARAEQGARPSGASQETEMARAARIVDAYQGTKRTPSKDRKARERGREKGRGVLAKEHWESGRAGPEL